MIVKTRKWGGAGLVGAVASWEEKREYLGIHNFSGAAFSFLLFLHKNTNAAATTNTTTTTTTNNNNNNNNNISINC
jgi:hypothetical protein